MRIGQKIALPVIFLIWASVFAIGILSPDWLGPYGTSGDLLHLIILAGVLTFVFLAYVYVYGRGRSK